MNCYLFLSALIGLPLALYLHKIKDKELGASIALATGITLITLLALLGILIYITNLK